MKERADRLKTIKKIIKNQRISSQELLLGHLEEKGYSVTQATLSRDLKLLKVGKISEGQSGYYYSLPGEDERRESEMNYLHDIQRGFVSIEFSHNLCVLRTLSGHADSVALAFDQLQFAEMIGTIAGDDTVLIIMAQDVTADQFKNALLLKIPELEL